MKNIIFRLLLVFAALPLFSQTQVKGIVIDGITSTSLPDVTISVEGSSISTQTNGLGMFVLDREVPVGDQILVVSKNGFVTKRMPLVINDGTVQS